MSDSVLVGKIALVTGASRGLGQAFAVGLAQAGMSVGIIARTREDLKQTLHAIEEVGARGLAVPGDVVEGKVVREAVREVEEQLGPIDLLVNNAGVGEPFGPTWETDPDQWWRCQEVNVRGPLLSCHAVLPKMVARCRGRIINVASGAGTRGIPYMSSYVTSKAALIRFTESLAAETRDHGISVFCIQPGSVRTAMAEKILASSAENQWFPWLEEVYEKGWNLTPEPATRLVLYLASGKADALTGRFFHAAEDPAEVVRRAEQILRDDLYALRMKYRVT
jgi:NAD(P)-dependent dehydrogenase (short-subunit alcohol dehydrogenase family)